MGFASKVAGRSESAPVVASLRKFCAGLRGSARVVAGRRESARVVALVVRRTPDD
jgi:hypothetical protein